MQLLHVVLPNVFQNFIFPNLCNQDQSVLHYCIFHMMYIPYDHDGKCLNTICIIKYVCK